MSANGISSALQHVKDVSAEDDGPTVQDRIGELCQTIASNPRDFAAHSELVSILRSVQLTNECDAARRMFHQHFAFTESQWMQWINDTDDAHRRTELFRTAVAECVSASLWRSYLQHVKSVDRAAYTDELHQQALQACGLYYCGGWELWIDYVQFKHDQLMHVRMDQKADFVREIANLIVRISAIPLHAASNPSFDTAETANDDFEARTLHAMLMQYAVFLSSEDAAELASRLSSNVAAIAGAKKKRKRFERNIHLRIEQCGKEGLDVASDASTADWFVTLLGVEHEGDDDQRIVSVYERAISTCPLVAKLWIMYGEFVSVTRHQLSSGERLYRRALRFYPWSGQIWAALFETLEEEASRLKVPFLTAPYHEVYRESMNHTMHGSEYAVLIQAYGNILVRAFMRSTQADEKAAVRQAFDGYLQECVDFFAQDATLDPTMSAVRLCARMEIRVLGGQLSELLPLFENTFVRLPSLNRDPSFWKEYADLYLPSDPSGSAKVLKRGLFNVQDPTSAKYLAHEWLSTLRLYSTDVHDVRQCELAAKQRILQVEENLKKRTLALEREAHKVASASSRSEASAPVEGEPPRKRARVEEPSSSTASGPSPSASTTADKLTLFVTNLPQTTVESEFRSHMNRFKDDIVEVRLVRDRNNRNLCKGIAYVQMKSADSAAAAIEALNLKKFEGKTLFFKYSDRPLEERPPRPPRQASGSEEPVPRQQFQEKEDMSSEVARPPYRRRTLEDEAHSTMDTEMLQTQDGQPEAAPKALSNEDFKKFLYKK